MTAMITDFEIIQHLDFDPHDERTCDLKIRRGYGHEPCPHVAEWVVTTLKDCGHSKDTYLCDSCYQRAIINPAADYFWVCDSMVGGSKCGYAFSPRDAAIHVERIK